MIDELERLANLWKVGALTDEEFAEQKQRLFAAQAAVPATPPEQAVDDSFSPVSGAIADVTASTNDDLLFDDLNVLLDAPVSVETQTVAQAELPAEDVLSLDDLDAMLDIELVDVAAPPAPDEIPEVAEVVRPHETSLPTEDDLLFDDLSALLAAEASDTSSADMPDAVEAPPLDDTLSFDDLNAMMDAELSDITAPDLSPTVTEVASPVEIASVEEVEPLEHADALFDDLNAMLDGELASMAAADAPLARDEAAPADASLVEDQDAQALFDDLNAMLDAELSGMASPDAPLAFDEAAPADVSLVEDADALFDDLDAMLDAELSSMAPSAADEAVSSIEGVRVDEPQPLEDADALFDDLNAMLDDELASMAPSEMLLATDVATPSAEAAQLADDDLLFDDLNALLADAPLAPAPEVALASEEPARPVEEMLARGVADDLDLAFEDRESVADVAMPEPAFEQADAIAAAEPAVVEEAAAEPVSAPLPTPEAPVPAPQRKIALGLIFARLLKIRLPRPAFLQRLPQPVLLGIGAVALFTSSMGAGVVLALATKSEAHAKERVPVKSHDEEVTGEAEGYSADAGPSGEGASDHE